MRFVLGDLTATQAVLLLGQNHDRPALRRLVGQARELSGIGQFAVADAFDGDELDRLPVAQRDRSGLIQQQRVDVARRLHGFSAHREHVVLHHAIHSGDADGGKQAADRRGNQANEQGDQHRNGRSSAAARRLQSLYFAYGGSVTTASRKINVRPAIRMFRAISFGVFCRSAPSTSAIMRSRNVSPGLDVILILI